MKCFQGCGTRLQPPWLALLCLTFGHRPHTFTQRNGHMRQGEVNADRDALTELHMPLYHAFPVMLDGSLLPPGRHSTLQVASSSVEKSWFAFGRTIFGASVEIPADESRALPTDKLTCKRSAHHAGKQYRPVVLLSCGSFNPPTYAHLRMFELAAQELTKVIHSSRRCTFKPIVHLLCLI